MKDEIKVCCPAMLNKEHRFIYYSKGNFAYNIKRGQFGFRYNYDEVMPVEYCPFCGEKLSIKEIDPVRLLVAIMRGQKAGTVSLTFTISDYFDELGMKEDDRSDFIFYVIYSKALEEIKDD